MQWTGLKETNKSSFKNFRKIQCKQNLFIMANTPIWNSLSWSLWVHVIPLEARVGDEGESEEFSHYLWSTPKVTNCQFVREILTKTSVSSCWKPSNHLNWEWSPGKAVWERGSGYQSCGRSVHLLKEDSPEEELLWRKKKGKYHHGNSAGCHTHWML